MGIAATIFLLGIVIADGAVFSWIYGRHWPLAARLCAGACTGLALLSTLGFLLAEATRALTGAGVWLALALVTALAAVVARIYRSRMREELAEAAGNFRAGLRSGMTIFHIGLVILLGMVFSMAVYTRDGSIYTGVANNLGDLPFHMQIISSFTEGHNFPPQDPTHAGVRFGYPFLADLLTAMLMRAGASMITAMWLQSMVLVLALVGLVHYWTLQLTGERLAARLAPLLLLFSGGLGWWALFQDVRNSNDGLFALLPHLPHAYTINLDAFWRWGNSLTTLFIPQRSILLGMPLAVVIFTVWWQMLNAPEGTESSAATDDFALLPNAAGALPAERRPTAPTARRGGYRGRQPMADSRPGGMMVAGGLAGLLPLLHPHTYLVVMAMAGCLLLLFPRQWRAWAAFFPLALLIAIPEVLWTRQGSGIDPQTFFGWYFGWDHGQANALWFWLANTGAFLPLLVIALLWRCGEEKLAPAKLLRFYLPFLLCFIVPNLMRFAPWGWDNIKVLIYWYLASVPLVALLLAAWWRQPGILRWAAAGLFVTMTLAGTLDLTRVVTGGEENREFDADGIAIARAIRARTGPRAVVLHAPTYNPPVFLTGRPSLLGYPGQAWSRGLTSAGRQKDIQWIYEGSPQAPALLRQYHVGYVLISPQERTSMTVNDAFWSQFPVIAEAGEYRLYQVGEAR